MFTCSPEARSRTEKVGAYGVPSVEKEPDQSAVVPVVTAVPEGQSMPPPQPLFISSCEGSGFHLLCSLI